MGLEVSPRHQKMKHWTHILGRHHRKILGPVDTSDEDGVDFTASSLAGELHQRGEVVFRVLLELPDILNML
jgi:hypothetical protein